MNVEFKQFIKQMNTGPREWHNPIIFDFTNEDHLNQAEALYKSGQITTSVDNLKTITADLFNVMHPNILQPYSESGLAIRDNFMDTYQRDDIEYGKWVFFPWLDQLVHYPSKEHHQLLRTARNRELVTSEEQARLLEANIGVFGLSVGSRVCESLVISGIGGTYVLGDTDSISSTNLNRISGSVADLDETKISKVAKNVSLTDPYVEQIHFPEGFTDGFSSNQRLSIIVDEVDDLKSKVGMRIFARENGIALIMATDIGDSSIIDIERYDQGYEEPFHGKIKEKDLERISSGDFTDVEKRKYLAKLIGLSNVSARLISSMTEQEVTLSGIPQLANTAVIGGGLVAIASREILLGRTMKSGRYVLKTKNILGMKSPTGKIETAKIFLDALKAIKSDN